MIVVCRKSFTWEPIFQISSSSDETVWVQLPFTNEIQRVSCTRKIIFLGWGIVPQNSVLCKKNYPFGTPSEWNNEDNDNGQFQ